MNRKYSLKKSHDIDRLVARKQSVGNRYYAVYYDSTDHGPLIAISVTRKVKTAVERNYLKKTTKEILRPLLPVLMNLKALIVVKATVADLTFAQKTEQLTYLIKRINKEK